MAQTKVEEKEKTRPRFQSMYGYHAPKTVSNSGDKTRPVFKTYQPFQVDPETGEALNPTPLPVRKVVGEVDIQKEIQAYRESTDLHCILKQLAYQGQSLPDSTLSDELDDLTELPKTLAEVKQSQDLVRKTQQELKKLLDQNAQMQKKQGLPVQGSDSGTVSLSKEEYEAFKQLLNHNKGGDK